MDVHDCELCPCSTPGETHCPCLHETAPEPREDVAVAEVLTDDELNELVDLIAEARDRAPRLPTDADSWDVLAAIEPVIGRIIAERVRAAAVEALRLVREVEREMSAQAFDAWRSADARRGLADHDALLAHADALTRWSERLRMAFDGQDYRADRRAER